VYIDSILHKNIAFVCISVKMSSLLVKKLVENAAIPTRGSEGAAGYDIASVENTVIPALGRAAVSTGISIRVPDGTYGRIAPRSGLAYKYGIDVLAGVIDSDYTGEVKVILYNTSERDYIVKSGDRIAQLVLEQIVTPDVAVVLDLNDTTRGSGGFGSTGI
jgi:dUTP pyrophosphatase